jgi:hypothetical protein
MGATRLTHEYKTPPGCWGPARQSPGSLIPGIRNGPSVPLCALQAPAKGTTSLGKNVELSASPTCTNWADSGQGANLRTDMNLPATHKTGS